MITIWPKICLTDENSKYKTRFLIPPNGFCHTPCPITLKICLPRQEILAFSHFFSASRPPWLNILSCRSQQSSLLLCFPGYYVSIFFEFFSIIKPLKTMWSRFFFQVDAQSWAKIYALKILVLNWRCQESSKRCILKNTPILEFAKMELRTYFWRTPKRRRKKPLTRYGQRLLEGPIIYLFDMEVYNQSSS